MTSRTVALVDVNRHLRELLQCHHGVVSRADALATVPRGVLEHAVGAGQLVRLLPRVYVDAARVDEPRARARAALCYAGPEAALSHLSALAAWRLPGGTLDPPVHVLVPADGRRRGGTGLELYSYDHIFAGPDLPRIERDARIRLATGRSIYLDVYCPAAKVNFELDGAAHHTSPGDRERDARRDAILATMGIMVVRFTHHQLVHTPDLVREQIRQIVAARLAAPRS